MAARDPVSFELGANGKIRITWDPADDLEGVDTSYFANCSRFEYGFDSGVASGVNYVPAPTTSVYSRARLTNRRNTRVSSFVSEHEPGVAISLAGGDFTYHSPDPPGIATRVGFNNFGGGNQSNVVSTPTTGTLTANNYTGVTTDIELNDVPWGTDAVPLVVLDGNVVTFRFSGRRTARVNPTYLATVTSRVVVRENGSPFSTSSVVLTQTAEGTQIDVTLGASPSPTATIDISISADTFDIADTQAAVSDWNDVASVGNCLTENAPVTATGTDDPPSINSIDLDPSFTGTSAGRALNIYFEPSTCIVDNTASIVLSVDGSVRTLQYVSEGVAFGTLYRVTYHIVGDPIYENQDVTGTYPAGRVGLDFDTGNTNLAESINLNAGSDGATAPAPIPVAAEVLANGTQVVVQFDDEVDPVSGAPAIAAEFSPGASQVLTMTSPFTYQGGDKRFPIYNLSDSGSPVRNFDNVAVLVPAGIVEGVQPNPQGNTSATILATSTVNNSEVVFDPPVYQSSEINGNGNAILITFDIPISLHPTFGRTVIDDNLKVQATDFSSGDEREFTPDTGQDIEIQSETTLSVRLSSAGLIFEFDDPDGDSPVHFDTNGTAGLVVSEASTGPTNTDALALWAVVDEDELVTNNSTQPEPASAVTPTFVLARIDNIGANQYLSIRWDNGSSTSIQVQRSTALPTLVGALTGTITLEFESIQDGAGDNDEIRYLVTGTQLRQDPDEGTITLDIPASVVVSNTTGTPNAETLSASPVTNNSNIPAPQPSQTPPVIQQIYIDTTGTVLGIYYDVVIDSGPGSTGTLDCTQRGSLTLTRKAVDANDSTLLLFDINNTVFRGETAFASLVASVAVNTENTLQNAAVNNVEVVNNSLVPVLSPPIIDMVTLDNAGTTITATFNKAIEAGAGTAYIQSSLTGRHTVTITSISGAVATIDVAGIVFEEESTVTLNLEPDFVRESQFSFTSNERLEVAVDVSGRTSAAPDLPTIAKGLNLE